MASKPRTRIYEIEDIDTENVDMSLLGSVKNFFLGRHGAVAEVHQHDLHEFPHRIRIKEITTDEEYEIRPIGQRVREWFLGRGGATDRETVSATTVHPILDKAREAGTSATERIKSAAYEASPSAASVVSAVSTAATEAVHGGARVVEGAERIAEAVTAPISRVVHSASSVYGAATSSVSRAAGEVEDRAEDMAREARRRLEQAGQAARNTAGNLVLGSSIGSRSGSMIDQAPVTALYTVLGTLILVWLMRRVWLQRLASNVFLGDGTVEMIKEATVAATHDDGSLAPETIERESSVSPVSLPPSPLADREGATSSRTVEKTTTVRTVPVEHTKVVYRRHTSLTRRQESVNEFAMVFLPMILLSLFAEASGMARPLLHLAWATWAVAQMAYHAYGIEGTKDTHHVGPGRRPGLYGTWASLIGLSVPVVLEATRAAIRG